MSLGDALQEGSRLLEGVDTPFLDAQVLLAHTLGLTREKLLASFPEFLSRKNREKYRFYLDQRLKGIPVACIVGEKEFFGRPFRVNSRVLTPRPDTEIMVETALKAAETLRAEGFPSPLRTADVCTGSGCIALSLVLEDPLLRVTASDISPAAAEVFAENRRILCPDKGEDLLRFRRGNLLEEDPGPYDMILSNPPYLTTEEVGKMRSGGWMEPELALDGGAEGLDFLRTISEQSRDRLVKKGYLIMEAASAQMAFIELILHDQGFEDIRIHPDLGGRNRVIEGRFGGT